MEGENQSSGAWARAAILYGEAADEFLKELRDALESADCLGERSVHAEFTVRLAKMLFEARYPPRRTIREARASEAASAATAA